MYQMRQKEEPMEEKDLRALLACPLFCWKEGDPLPLARETLENPLASVRTFEKDETLYGPAQFERSLGVLCAGRCEVTKDAPGGQTVVMSRLGKSALFGAAALFHRRPAYVTSIRALERCRAVFLPEELLKALFQKDFRLTEAYLSYLTERILFLNRRIDAFTAGSAAQRLAAYLLTQSVPLEGGGLGLCWSSGNRLAQALNVGRASLYRAIDQLEESGLIQKEQKTLRILDAERLKKEIMEENEP